jgi:hypothetical protein
MARAALPLVSFLVSGVLVAACDEDVECQSNADCPPNSACSPDGECIAFTIPSRDFGSEDAGPVDLGPDLGRPDAGRDVGPPDRGPPDLGPDLGPGMDAGDGGTADGGGGSPTNDVIARVELRELRGAQVTVETTARFEALGLTSNRPVETLIPATLDQDCRLILRPPVGSLTPVSAGLVSALVPAGTPMAVNLSFTPGTGYTPSSLTGPIFPPGAEAASFDVEGVAGGVGGTMVDLSPPATFQPMSPTPGVPVDPRTGTVFTFATLGGTPQGVVVRLVDADGSVELVCQATGLQDTMFVLDTGAVAAFYAESPDPPLQLDIGFETAVRLQLSAGGGGTANIEFIIGRGSRYAALGP